MTAKPKGLGRGLNAIFDLENVKAPQRQTVSMMEELEITIISPNPKQPRSYFDEDALEGLADSIKVLGVIQPITVHKESDDKYTIIAEKGAGGHLSWLDL